MVVSPLPSVEAPYCPTNVNGLAALPVLCSTWPNGR